MHKMRNANKRNCNYNPQNNISSNFSVVNFGKEYHFFPLPIFKAYCKEPNKQLKKHTNQIHSLCFQQQIGQLI